jgi:hypothetical protein
MSHKSHMHNRRPLRKRKIFQRKRHGAFSMTPPPTIPVIDFGVLFRLITGGGRPRM